MYWLNELSRHFLSNGYLSEGESVEDRLFDIAKNAENILGVKGFANKFLDYTERGYFLFSSPVWANFGKKRGLPISCYGSYVGDSVEEILDSVSEIGMMTKLGGGTSAYLGDVRKRGSSISTGGKSDGSVNFMRLYDTVVDTCKQSSVRRGAMAVYLPIDHGDINEFLSIKHEGHPIQHLFTGVCISNDWMESMINGDEKKREVWAKVIKSRSEIGLPYLFFSDNANNNAPKCYRENGYVIKNSNLCVSGNQRVVTNRGLITAKELYEQGGSLKLFDGEKIVDSSEMKLIGRNEKVYRVTLDNGMSHEITGYHKISVDRGVKYEDVACEDLTIGDKVRVQTKKGIFGGIGKPFEAFLLGLYQSDGTQYNDYIMFDVWEHDFDLLDEIKKCHDYVCSAYDTQKNFLGRRYDKPIFSDCQVLTGNVRKKRLSSKACKKALNFEKGYIPDWIWEADENTHWQYLRGLLYADGTVLKSSSRGESIQIAYTDTNKSFLCELQLLCANLGLQTSIRVLREAGESLLPDGKGGRKYYNTKKCWRLIIGNKNDAIEIEKRTGFLSRKGVFIEEREYRDNIKKSYKIVSIERIEDQDVYCLKVDSDEHHWVCNGIITHNCSEIMLPVSSDESFVCCLSSMNLLHYDKWKNTDAVKILAYFLDAVISEFCLKAFNNKMMERAARFAYRHRAIGIGACGYHSYLQSMMIPFESLEAKMINHEMFSTINEHSLEASKERFMEAGGPVVLAGYGERWATRMAIAPNTSSAFILGQVSQSVEPYKSNYYVKDLAKSKTTIKNPYLQKLLLEKGRDVPAVWASILSMNGSVQHLDFLSEKEKDVFRTFSEISQKEIITHAAIRQKSIDQGQSINTVIPPDTTAKEINKLYIYAWESGLKSLYYQHSSNAAQGFYRKLNECKSCEG